MATSNQECRCDESGIMILPLILSLVIASILTGIVVSKVGYYTPFLLAGAVFMATGAGLMTTFKVDTNHAKWIGYHLSMVSAKAPSRS
ncbi:hypothetical protein V1515DRAFT_609917 [Lipomyces mesembrius]